MNLKLASQQYRAWSDSKEVQAGLALANYFSVFWHVLKTCFIVNECLINPATVLKTLIFYSTPLFIYLPILSRKLLLTFVTVQRAYS